MRACYGNAALVSMVPEQPAASSSFSASTYHGDKYGGRGDTKWVHESSLSTAMRAYLYTSSSSGDLEMLHCSNGGGLEEWTGMGKLLLKRNLATVPVTFRQGTSQLLLLQLQLPYLAEEVT